MEAVREHPVESFSPVFNPEGVPSLPDLPVTRSPATRNGLDLEDELHQLAQEKLFSGTRTRLYDTCDTGTQQVDAAADTARSIAQAPIGVSEELLYSLAAARQAAALALAAILREALGDTDVHVTADPFGTPDMTSQSDMLSSDQFRNQTDIDSLLSYLNQYLRESLEQEARMTAIPRTSPLAPEVNESIAARSPRQRLIEEIQARSETLLVHLPPLDADLVSALIRLLICTDRILSISASIPARRSRPSSYVDPESQQNVYHRLEREAISLQQNRKERWAPAQAAALLGAARAVEHAERELLWGRIDDLSEQVRSLSQQKAQYLQQGDQGEDVESEDFEQLAIEQCSPYEASISGLSDLPRYSHDQHGHYRPPAYDHDTSWEEKSMHGSETLSQHSPSHDDMSIKSSAPLLHPTASRSQRTRRRRISSVASEKMQRELDHVSQAIERLHAVAPQLANQRVDSDRTQVRERQLVKLGNAIERLSIGRLDDQRAMPSPMLDVDEEALRQRSKRRDDEALEHLVVQIDRAASRTLLDQRVDLNHARSKSSPLTAQTQTREALPAFDQGEANRREYIMQNTGKGRLASQDAVLPRSAYLTEAFPKPRRDLDDSVSIAEFFASDQASTSQIPLFARRGSDPGLLESVHTKRRFSSLKLGSLFNRASPSSSRRGSVVDVSDTDFRSSGKHESKAPAVLFSPGYGVGLGLSEAEASLTRSVEPEQVNTIEYIVEESRHVRTLTVKFWPIEQMDMSIPWSIVNLEVEALLVSPDTSDRPPSRIFLPSKIGHQDAIITSHATYFEIKLNSIAPQSTELQRPDLVVEAPLSTAELRQFMPSSFVCSTCDTHLVDASTVEQYNALPSEHWAELIDAWMCHQDQSLSDDLIAKGKGIKPRPGEGLVASTYLLFPGELVNNCVSRHETQEKVCLPFDPASEDWHAGTSQRSRSWFPRAVEDLIWMAD